MVRKLLCDYMYDSHKGVQYRIRFLFRPFDYSFNGQIGFGECHDIMLKIEYAMINQIRTIHIENCKFIEQIDIIYYRQLDHTDEFDEGDLYVNCSKLVSYENKKLTLELRHYDWKAIHCEQNGHIFMNFLYEKIRYSLFIAYYKYLKEFNPEHDFVKFTEFISRIDFYEIDEEISLGKYVNSLKETKQSIINEELFSVPVDRYYDIHRKSMVGCIE